MRPPFLKLKGGERKALRFSPSDLSEKKPLLRGKEKGNVERKEKGVPLQHSEGEGSLPWFNKN